MIIVHILLWILKIAGILLLLLLGIFLTAVLIVLFVPVRYELRAEGDIKEKERIKAFVSVRYLFRLIRFQASYENRKFRWEAGIAWKKIGQDKEKEEKEKEEQETEEKTKEMPLPEQAPGRKTKPIKNVKTEKSNGQSETKSVKQKKIKRQQEKSEPFIDNIRNKIKYTIQNICDKIKTLSEIKDRTKKFINDEVHRAAFKKGKRVVFHFVKQWLPKEADGYVEYGFDDPYYTGKLLSYLALFYPFFGKWLRIVPDFEETALSGHVYVKGHLRMNHLAAAAVRLVADKNIRSTAKEVLRLIRHQKKEES